jgi:hypothetical protein
MNDDIVVVRRHFYYYYTTVSTPPFIPTNFANSEHATTPHHTQQHGQMANGDICCRSSSFLFGENGPLPPFSFY